MGGKTRNIVIQLVLQEVTKQVAVFVASFTVASDRGFLAFPANRERQEV